MNDPVKRLTQISTTPSDREAFNAWLQGQDAIDFLIDNAREDEFVVYAGIGSTFMHGIVVPAALVNPPDLQDLLSWSCDPWSSWGTCCSYSDKPEVSISPPLDHTRSKTLDRGEQLVFGRSFAGRLGDKSYFEVLQKFVHLFDLHFLPERDSYCRLDKRGDVEDAIRIVSIPAKNDSLGGSIVTFDRDLLEQYLALTESVIVRTFDFTRIRPSEFICWSAAETERCLHDDLFYRSRIEPGKGSYMRGVQIVRPVTSKEALRERFSPTYRERREYASFIAHDWKNNVVTEISCAPGHTANYFTKSELPYETSPVFFRPEVLSKYKSDSEKYRLQDRSISCRGAWYLQTYDINEAGQVHTYIVYLQALPYEEQLYWKSYNEPPKGPISKRALKTDFEGNWDLEYDALSSLKRAFSELHRQHVPWWTQRTEKLLDQVHYPATSSPDEWANEILLLDQLIVEGFEERWLRQEAQSLGRTPDLQFRSLKLIEECLTGLGFEQDHARQITEPFHSVHALRSKLKGHASGEDATAIKRRALAEHGSYKEHFRNLCQRCDESIRTVSEALKRA